MGDRIGQGTFSEVFVAYQESTKEVVAVKVEKAAARQQQQSQLVMESKVLRSLQAYPFFPRMLALDEVDEDAGKGAGSSRKRGRSSSGDARMGQALVMQLLGESITQLRLRQPVGRFRPSCALDLCLQMLHGRSVARSLRRSSGRGWAMGGAKVCTVEIHACRPRWAS